MRGTPLKGAPIVARLPPLVKGVSGVYSIKIFIVFTWAAFVFEILTAEEMRRADKAAIDSGTSGFDLMQAAGKTAAAEITSTVTPCPVLVLCGPGNNGGDGFVIAARLKAAGWSVRLACTVKKTALKGDAALAAAKWDGEVEALNSNLALRDTKLVVDAIYGTGFKGTLDPELVTLLDKIRTKKCAVVAIDIPSGIDASAASVAEGTLKADLTITFARRKIAHSLGPTRYYCGRIVRKDIGISDDIIAQTGSNCFENNPALWLANFPIPDHNSHKYTRGHALVYAGTERTGAGYLAAMAAQRAGAGIVSIACAPVVRHICATARSSLLIEDCTDLETFKEILRDQRKTAHVIGPGAMGRDMSADILRDYTLAALGHNKACVLDGDIFTAFADKPVTLFEKMDPTRHVLTPHAGEVMRLFGDLKGSKLEQARSAAAKANAVIVFKGAETIIAEPAGLAVIDTGAPPTLATAGSGDVLAGLIAGLAAQGMPVFFAACAAVWLQGAAARKAGLGLVAEDIISLIPQALNDLYPTGQNNA